MMAEEVEKLTTWAPIAGKWEFVQESAKYLGPKDPGFPHGIVLSTARLRRGSIKTRVCLFDKPQKSEGRIVFGYNAETRGYLSAGIGGHGFAYALSEFLPGTGWKRLRGAGNVENFLPDSEFQVEIRIDGQEVNLTVNGVGVLKHSLPRPLGGDQVGLFAWGPGPVEFKACRVVIARPKAFVVMQFGEPYDALYTEVIRPVAEEMGLEAYRADEVYRPGIILQDIIRGIVESEVIIVEITPPNRNVFYELGYAHAMDKTTILLAERDGELPFDIRSYRCIFYDNTIRGKKDVENSLRSHLTSILQRS